jgi:hypothetical protein
MLALLRGLVAELFKCRQDLGAGALGNILPPIDDLGDSGGGNAGLPGYGGKRWLAVTLDY